MRIAQIAPLYKSVPPKLYGGTERVVACLTDALVQRGHEVVLFASGDSKTRAELVPCREIALRLDKKLSWDVPAHLAMLAKSATGSMHSSVSFLTLFTARLTA